MLPSEDLGALDRDASGDDMLPARPLDVYPLISRAVVLALLFVASTRSPRMSVLRSCEQLIYSSVSIPVPTEV